MLPDEETKVYLQSLKKLKLSLASLLYGPRSRRGSPPQPGWRAWTLSLSLSLSLLTLLEEREVVPGVLAVVPVVVEDLLPSLDGARGLQHDVWAVGQLYPSRPDVLVRAVAVVHQPPWIKCIRRGIDA